MSTSMPTAMPATAVEPSRGFWSATWRRLRGRPTGLAGLGFIGLMFLVAFFAPMLAGDKPIACRFDGRVYFPALVQVAQQLPLGSRLLAMPDPFTDANYVHTSRRFDASRGDWGVWPLVPYSQVGIVGGTLEPGSGEHWLGTDGTGRDVLARLVHGTSVSMKVGFISMGIAALIGIFLGALAGDFGSWIDVLISRFIEIVMCFPTLFLILSVLAWLPPRIENVMVVIGCTGWTGIARYTRGEFLKLRNMEYAAAARALGAGPARIIFRHLLPNALAPVMVSVTFGIASAILIEAALSWLGFGVQPPQPSWGNILQEGYGDMAAHMILASCAAIFLAVLSFNLVGDALRDAIDPRMRAGSGRRR